MYDALRDIIVGVYNDQLRLMVQAIWISPEDAHALYNDPRFTPQSFLDDPGTDPSLLGLIPGARVHTSALVPHRHAAFLTEGFDGTLIDSSGCVRLAPWDPRPSVVQPPDQQRLVDELRTMGIIVSKDFAEANTPVPPPRDPPTVWDLLTEDD